MLAIISSKTLEHMIMTEVETVELGFSSDMLSKIAANTSNAVIVTDLKGKILYVNEGFERITEYSRKEAIGKKPGFLLQGPNTNPDTIKSIRKGLKNFERVNETILNYAKSGRPYWLQLDIFPMFDAEGVPEYFMAIESDVTELKENERLASEQNKRIQENISYAQILQNSLFRENNNFKNIFHCSFIVDRPKDVVGGDFYFADVIQGKKVLLLGDCTGHGVSGAIMTALAISAIKEQLAQYKTLSPGLILTKALEKLSSRLSAEDNYSKDSFEATLLFIDENKKSIRYASMNQSMYLTGEEVDQVIKNKAKGALTAESIEGSISYKPETMLYLSSDGFQDQFGGKDDKKFTSASMRKLFNEIHTSKCGDQKEAINKTLSEWIGLGDQTDDILTIGIRL